MVKTPLTSVEPVESVVNTCVATLFHNDQYHDDNDDNWLDLTLATRGSFLCALQARCFGTPTAELSTRYYYEDRIGGTADYVKIFRCVAGL